MCNQIVKEIIHGKHYDDGNRAAIIFAPIKGQKPGLFRKVLGAAMLLLGLGVCVLGAYERGAHSDGGCLP